MAKDLLLSRLPRVGFTSPTVCVPPPVDCATCYLSSLKTDAGEPIPFIFRPWHENNGAWFWWGNTHCTPDEYRALYALTQDNLKSQITNLKSQIVWSYSPNLDGAMTEEKFLQWYPGDERIDLIGLDAYQWGTEEDFVHQTNADLDFLCAFAADHHKLVALTECGFIDVPDVEHRRTVRYFVG